MKKLFLMLFVCLGAWLNTHAAKQTIQVRTHRTTTTGSVDRVPAVCPIKVTYDPETREIEMTGRDDDVMEIQIFDDRGNWLVTCGRTPYTYQVTITYQAILYVHIYAYEWEAVSAGIPISAH